ncbi:translation initiation factor eIF-2 beta subunit [Balamuthia mandrillaris]
MSDTEETKTVNTEEEPQAQEEEEVVSFDFGAKKRRGKGKRTKGKAAGGEGDAAGEGIGEGGTAGEGASGEGASPMRDDEEYQYEFLLSRALEQIESIKASKNKGTKVPLAKAFRVGSTRTSWANFPETLKALNRDPQHLLTYVSVELGTPVNLDGSGRLMIKGQYFPKQIDKIVAQYIQDYVVCKTCGSRDTSLVKENRLYFVECNSTLCASKRSVSALNKGYVHNIRRNRGN